MQIILSLSLPYIVFIGALASPGPDLLIVMRNALGHHTRAGVLTAAGIALGNIIHMGYCFAGIALLISQSVALFNLIKWVGAGYLVYIGVQSLRSKGQDLTHIQGTDTAGMTNKGAFKSGLICNLLNPKATMFFLAWFSQMIDPAMSLSLQLSFLAFCVITAFLWFSLIAFLMGRGGVRRAYSRASQWIDRIFGGFFIALGVKLAFVKMV